MDFRNFLMQQFQILSYLPQTDQPQLQFILPRREQASLDIDVKYIQLRQQIQKDQIKSVLSYASTQLCRSKQLLYYFGETNADKCGFCDICLAERKVEEAAQLNDKIDFEIITLLQSEHYNLDDLVNGIETGVEKIKIERIRELLDAGKIKTDGKKYYL